jgi:hypothetical protein
VWRDASRKPATRIGLLPTPTGYYLELQKFKLLQGRVDMGIIKLIPNTLTPYEQAGRLIRLTAWISIFPIIGFDVAIIKNYAPNAIGVAIILALSVIFLWLIFLLGNAVKTHKNWARVIGVIYGIILLFGFPLGTFIGAFLINYLMKGWEVVVKS